MWIPKPGRNEKSGPWVFRRFEIGWFKQLCATVLEPIFEQDFAEHSYGFRPGRGCKDALRRVDALLQAGVHPVVDADLKSYFDTIPHDRLMARLREKIADNAVLAIVDLFSESTGHG